jgi:hypothetical protein
MINLPAGYIVYGGPKINHNRYYGYYVVIYSVDPRPELTDDQRHVPFYLHSDGVWRLSTSFKGEFTGYYETKFSANEAAEFALKSAIGDKDNTITLLPCPFCGHDLNNQDIMDTIYPAFPHIDEDGVERYVYNIVCQVTAGGCDASILGSSAEDCVTKWNTRKFNLIK